MVSGFQDGSKMFPNQDRMHPEASPKRQEVAPSWHPSAAELANTTAIRRMFDLGSSRWSTLLGVASYEYHGLEIMKFLEIIEFLRIEISKASWTLWRLKNPLFGKMVVSRSMTVRYVTPLEVEPPFVSRIYMCVRCASLSFSRLCDCMFLVLVKNFLKTQQLEATT